METWTVIGGSGAIGRALVDALPEGCAVRVVSRTGHQSSSRPGLEEIIADVSDAAAISQAIKGSDVVFLLTTAATSGVDDLARDIVEGARNVADACLAHQVRRLVFTSSIAALYLGGKGVVTEKDGPDPKPQYRNYYARYKIAAEALFQLSYRKSGLPVVIVRPGIVLGRGCIPTHGGFGHWASNICCLGFGSGRNPLPFVLVQDVAQALVAASVIPGIEGHSFNLAGDVSFSAREFIAIIAEHSHRRHVYFPYTIIRRWEHIWKWALKVVGRKNANRFPWKRDMASMACISTIDCTASKQVLNWTPNNDVERFVAEAIDAHLPSLSDWDLRLRSRRERELDP